MESDCVPKADANLVEVGDVIIAIEKHVQTSERRRFLVAFLNSYSSVKAELGEAEAKRWKWVFKAALRAQRCSHPPVPLVIPARAE